MFDISFSELLIIAVIALVVLGPERLPKVARTVGHLLGRAQRYVNDVKRDIQKEMDLDEVQKLKKEMEDASASVKDTVSDLEKQFTDPLKDAKASMEELGQQTEQLAQELDQTKRAVSSSTTTDATTPKAAVPESEAMKTTTTNTHSTDS